MLGGALGGGPESAGVAKMQQAGGRGCEAAAVVGVEVGGHGCGAYRISGLLYVGLIGRPRTSRLAAFRAGGLAVTRIGVTGAGAEFFEGTSWSRGGGRGRPPDNRRDGGATLESFLSLQSFLSGDDLRGGIERDSRRRDLQHGAAGDLREA